MFECTNKIFDQLLSFYRFQKIKINTCLELRILTQSPQNTSLKLLHRTNMSKKNINYTRIYSVNFKADYYFNKPKA